MKNPIATLQGLSRSREFQHWTLFCFFIFLLKILLFAADPQPKFVMGDSGSYIWTALTGWIPPDRSYFYGYVIRWSAVWSESLTSLLLVQLTLSAATSVLAALISRLIFNLPLRWAFLIGFLCAIDPVQLLWERYVMTETSSLCLYAFVLYYSLQYLKGRRLRDLILVQVMSVVLIGFRMSFLLLVQVNAVILPLIAFAPDIWQQIRRRSPRVALSGAMLRLGAGHLLLSATVMFILHTGYKSVNGRLAMREPAYLHTTGTTILALWAPILQPEDGADPEIAELLRHGDEFNLKDFDHRTSQLFAPGFLIDRLTALVPDPAKAEVLAKRTAFNALRRDPMGILSIAFKNYSLYWRESAMKSYAEADFSFFNPPTPDLITLMGVRFHLAHTNSDIKTLLQRYYVVAWPYYYVLLVAPVFAAITVILRSRRKHAVLLFVHASLIVGVSVTFGGPTIRYFLPVSLIMLLVVALWLKAFEAYRQINTAATSSPGVLGDSLLSARQGEDRRGGP